MQTADLIIWIAIMLGVFYAALLPWYKKNEQLIAANLPVVAFDKKYIASIIVNAILNIFVVILAVTEFGEVVNLTGTMSIGVLIGAFIWGAQSQKIVALIPDWLMYRINQPGGATIPEPIIPKPPSPPSG